MSICKNGIIISPTVYESDAMKMNSKDSYSYVPAKDTVNSTMGGQRITGFIPGKKYYAEMILSWENFIENANSQFVCWVQGSAFDGTAWIWSVGNPLVGALKGTDNGRLQSLFLSKVRGSKLVCGFFTVDRTGYELGFRTDYSNGVGKVTFSEIKVIPAEYAVTPPRENLDDYSNGHIGKDYMSFGEITEY